MDILQDLYRPAVLEMIHRIIEAGYRCGCRIGVYYEPKPDIRRTELFLRMGVDAVTVPLSTVQPLFQLICSLIVDKQIQNERWGEGFR